MDERVEQGGAAAAVGVGGAAGVVRRLFDINTITGPRVPRWFLWTLARLGLLVVGNVIGRILWELVTGEPAGDRGLVERVVCNAYLWACLVATGVYALYDRRQRTGTD
ncbi:hypothetical protein Kfla_5125 [Kribbella flavida DSM 17836]|uniref:Uncharacterized protein n=1 Tax=Kribbella flavida (strain DSM 17836 / JCM 10339 / NBRC 14399) TaxID=479435 RepID=D2Q3L8_KRIFD|nr:hypothetical protein [Kribbella flavida]ADB34141.1 hypothetical protein Kfla_5125 [Kribbella flavida DSM 17836]